MRLVQRLPQRWQNLVHEMAKFGTIGVINLAVNLSVTNVLWLTVLHDGEVKAKAIGTLVATTAAYFMNRHWTYRDRPKSTLRREYALFFFFNMVGLIIESATVYLGKYGLHLTHWVALNAFAGIGIVLGTIFRFWAYRTHVFKKEPAETVAMEAFAAVPPELADEPDAAATKITQRDEVPTPVAAASAPAEPAPANGATGPATTGRPRTGGRVTPSQSGRRTASANSR
ncbi:GtrA family protein [Luedemannella helvata]|uniref:GtrA/DPMS transmembrane domain-containing protein n=1 Tax=Luedemannella helvata TaxID=349315 RepID=A0ABN2JPI7_9ACTN